MALLTRLWAAIDFRSLLVWEVSRRLIRTVCLIFFTFFVLKRLKLSMTSIFYNSSILHYFFVPLYALWGSPLLLWRCPVPTQSKRVLFANDARNNFPIPLLLSLRKRINSTHSLSIQSCLVNSAIPTTGRNSLFIMFTTWLKVIRVSWIEKHKRGILTFNKISRGLVRILVF